MLSKSLHVSSPKETPYRTLYTPPRLSALIPQKCKGQRRESEVDTAEHHDDGDDVEDHILHLVPTDILTQFDEETLQQIKNVNKAIANLTPMNDKSNCDIDSVIEWDVLEHFETAMDEEDKCTSINTANLSENDNCSTSTNELDNLKLNHPANVLSINTLTDILGSLQMTEKGQNKKWTNISTSDLQHYFQSSNSIDKHFTKQELLLCLDHEEMKKHISFPCRKQSGTKKMIVNMISKLFGNTSTLAHVHQPKSLRNILKDIFSRKYSKTAINAVIATNISVEDVL